MRLAILISHPIQYLVPFFQLIAKEKNVDLTVYYTWKFGVEKTFDEQFNTEIKWDIPLLSGYKYEFLKNYSPKPSSDFLGQICPGIIARIKKEKFDAIVIYGWNSFTNWMAIFSALFAGTKIFLRGESPLNQELAKPAWKISIKKLVLKPLFGMVSAILYIGEENRKFYRYYGVPEDKLFFVPYAVDNDRFIGVAEELKSQREALRRKLTGIEDDRPVILFTGKLIDKKRPMDLLSAFEIVEKNRESRAALVFVGDGVLRPELERYVKERDLKNVHFAGFRNQTELPEYYAIADIFVLPSGSGETWGLVVNEAMCFGLPVIVSDTVGCAKDLVTENKNGYVFPLGDKSLLAEKLSLLVNSAHRRKEFGKRSAEIIDGYSFNRGVSAIAGLLSGPGRI